MTPNNNTLVLNVQNMNKVVNTPSVKTLVASYLMQRAFTEIIRERVNAVYTEILNEIPIFEDMRDNSPRFANGERTRILNHNYLYLSEDEEAVQKIYDEMDSRLKKLQIKPENMEHDYCPALVEEEKLRDIEHLIIKETGNPFGVTVNKLVCGGNGLENYKKWIDLIVGAIVSLPDFENPLKKNQ